MIHYINYKHIHMSPSASLEISPIIPKRKLSLQYGPGSRKIYGFRDNKRESLACMYNVGFVIGIEWKDIQGAFQEQE